MQPCSLLSLATAVPPQTIAQDEATSVIFGMPREAIELDAVHEVVPLGKLRDKALAAVRKEMAR